MKRKLNKVNKNYKVRVDGSFYHPGYPCFLDPQSNFEDYIKQCLAYNTRAHYKNKAALSVVIDRARDRAKKNIMRNIRKNINNLNKKIKRETKEYRTKTLNKLYEKYHDNIYGTCIVSLLYANKRGEIHLTKLEYIQLKLFKAAIKHELKIKARKEMK